MERKAPVISHVMCVEHVGILGCPHDFYGGDEQGFKSRLGHRLARRVRDNRIPHRVREHIVRRTPQSTRERSGSRGFALLFRALIRIFDLHNISPIAV